MATLQIGRLQLGPPSGAAVEGVGDPVGTIGGTIVAAPRVPLQIALDVNTILNGAATLANAQTLRRQLRSAMNNTPMKMQLFLYVQYADDSEQNGWLVPGPMTFNSPDGTAWRAVGLWATSSASWYLAGRRNAMKEARSIWSKDLRTGLYERDQLGYVLSTDFNWLPAMSLTYLPNGASSLTNTVTDAVILATTMPTGRDGGACQQVATIPSLVVAPLAGLVDLAFVCYERSEAALNITDVIAYDRRGHLGPFYQQTVLADTPVSYWRVDETTGTTAADQQGINPGTYTGGFTLHQTGALTASGDTNAAVTLNGTTGYVSVPDSPSLRFTAAFSVETWIKPTNLTANGGIFGKGSDYALYYASSSGNISAEVGGVTGGAGAIAAGVWQHVVMTFANGLVTVYVNGVSIFSSSAGYPTSATVSASALRFGDVAAVGFEVGLIDEPAVYGYALTAQQVVSHYAAALAVGATGSSSPIEYGWEEVYGPDYPWSWLTTGGTQDAPVIENGLVRVRYDATGLPGFRVDVWNGTFYVEQGKMVVWRNLFQFDNTWVAARIVEYTPDRVVILCVLSVSADPYSNERVYITMQRGELSVEFECYPAIQAGGLSDVALVWAPAGEANASILKIDSQGSGSSGLPAEPPWIPGAAATAAYAATAGTGSGTGHSGQFSVGGSNYLPNGSFEHDTTGSAPAGWTAAAVGSELTTGATLTVVTTQHEFGLKALQIVTTATLNEGAAILLPGSYTAGQEYTFSVWLKGNAGGENVLLIIGTSSGSDIALQAVTLTTTWTEYQVAWSPSSTESSSVYAIIRSNLASVYTWFVDGASVQEGSGLSYFDGDSLNYVWSGTIGNSQSNPQFLPNPVTLGAASFASSENWVALLRSTAAYATVGPFQTNFSLIQAANVLLQYDSDSNAYGIASNALYFESQNNAGYLQVQVGFGATTTSQVMEAETIRNTGSGTTSQITDATASGGLAVQETQTAATNLTLTTASTLLEAGYRVMIRARADITVTQMSVHVNMTPSSTVILIPRTVWTWFDLGDLYTLAANPTWSLTAWRTGGSGNIYIDRVELVLTEDRVRTSAIWSGARDSGQAALVDSRTIGAIAVR